MAVENLIVYKREGATRASVKDNRRKGNVPGVFYMKGGAAIPFYVRDTAIRPFIYTTDVKIINLNIEGTDIQHNCILKDIQFDPVSDRPIHVDMYGISEGEKITVEVPINLVGSPAGVKDGGVLQHTLHKLEVECFPKDIPAHIDVNIAELKIGDAIFVENISIPNIEILAMPNSIIVSVVPPAAEITETPAEAPVEGEEAAAAEPEVISKGKKEEDEE